VRRSGPGEARTILLLHIISARPSKQPLMVRTFLKVHMELGSYFVSARTNITHHHRAIGDARLGRGGPHACSIGQNTAQRHGQRRPTAWRCGGDELPEGSSRESKLSL
jgi:hypothetical protein